MKRKHTAIFLATLMILILPFIAFGGMYVGSGGGSGSANDTGRLTCIWDLSGDVKTDATGQWKYVIADGGATITGYAAEPTGDLAIPGELDGLAVTGIGNGAFYNCGSLTGVTIPDSVTHIRSGAFSHTGLSDVTIPEGVKYIGWEAFAYTGLTSVTLPGSVDVVDSDTFDGCPITRIDVAPENPYYSQIDGVLFDKQGKELVSYPDGREGTYTVPDGVASIGYYAFGSCESLTGVTLPEGVTDIGNGAFSNCASLTSVTLPHSMRSIGECAFEDCKSLTAVTFPEGVENIGLLAFWNCRSLTTVTLPASVMDIGRSGVLGLNPFTGCPLTEINLSPNNPAYEVVDGVLFDTREPGYEDTGDYETWEPGFEEIGDVVFEIQEKELVSYPGGKEGAYAIPEGVTGIGGYAFGGCVGLTGVTIPRSVTWIGPRAFMGCTGLTSVTIPEGVTSIDVRAFENSGLKEVTIPASVSNLSLNPFQGCPLMSISVSPDNLVYWETDGVLFSRGVHKELVSCPGGREGEYTIPDGVTWIGNYAFERSPGLTSVTIPQSVTWIGFGAFEGCTGLTSVSIPDSVTTIMNDAFNLCESVTLLVNKGSFAEQYAKDNGIDYVYME